MHPAGDVQSLSSPVGSPVCYTTYKQPSRRRRGERLYAEDLTATALLERLSLRTAEMVSSCLLMNHNTSREALIVVLLSALHLQSNDTTLSSSPLSAPTSAKVASSLSLANSISTLSTLLSFPSMTEMQGLGGMRRATESGDGCLNQQSSRIQQVGQQLHEHPVSPNQQQQLQQPGDLQEQHQLQLIQHLLSHCILHPIATMMMRLQSIPDLAAIKPHLFSLDDLIPLSLLSFTAPLEQLSNSLVITLSPLEKLAYIVRSEIFCAMQTIITTLNVTRMRIDIDALGDLVHRAVKYLLILKLVRPTGQLYFPTQNDLYNETTMDTVNRMSALSVPTTPIHTTPHASPITTSLPTISSRVRSTSNAMCIPSSSSQSSLRVMFAISPGLFEECSCIVDQTINSTCGCATYDSLDNIKHQAKYRHHSNDHDNLLLYKTPVKNTCNSITAATPTRNKLANRKQTSHTLFQSPELAQSFVHAIEAGVKPSLANSQILASNNEEVIVPSSRKVFVRARVWTWNHSNLPTIPISPRYHPPSQYQAISAPGTAPTSPISVVHRRAHTSTTSSWSHLDTLPSLFSHTLTLNPSWSTLQQGHVASRRRQYSIPRLHLTHAEAYIPPNGTDDSFPQSPSHVTASTGAQSLASLCDLYELIHNNDLDIGDHTNQMITERGLDMCSDGMNHQHLADVSAMAP